MLDRRLLLAAPIALVVAVVVAVSAGSSNRGPTERSVATVAQTNDADTNDLTATAGAPEADRTATSTSPQVVPPDSTDPSVPLDGRKETDPEQIAAAAVVDTWTRRHDDPTDPPPPATANDVSDSEVSWVIVRHTNQIRSTADATTVRVEFDQHRYDHTTPERRIRRIAVVEVTTDGTATIVNVGED